VIAGAAVLATAGVAHAQERPAAPPSAATAETGGSSAALPWYQRFTGSNGVAENITGDEPSGVAVSPIWNLNQRWGLTVDVREADRVERLAESRGDQTSVGAFYQFTPNMRVGGAVSVETPRANAVAEEEPRADVRIESAFRF
jgi:hypothetical protein